MVKWQLIGVKCVAVLTPSIYNTAVWHLSEWSVLLVFSPVILIHSGMMYAVTDHSSNGKQMLLVFPSLGSFVLKSGSWKNETEKPVRSAQTLLKWLIMVSPCGSSLWEPRLETFICEHPFQICALASSIEVKAGVVSFLPLVKLSAASTMLSKVKTPNWRLNIGLP